jgi:hypothetical protein
MSNSEERKHHHDPFAAWQRSMEGGFQGWQTLFGQPAQFEVLQFWTMLFMRGMQTWVQVLQQGGSLTEAMAQWKTFMDESMESWAGVLHDTMDTEAFAAMSGRMLDQFLHAAGPLRANMLASTEELYRAVNLPSRKQVTSLASQVVAIDARLEALEDRLGQLARSLASLEALMRQPAAGSPDAGTPQPRPSKRGRNAHGRRDA